MVPVGWGSADVMEKPGASGSLSGATVGATAGLGDGGVDVEVVVGLGELKGPE